MECVFLVFYSEIHTTCISLLDCVNFTGDGTLPIWPFCGSQKSASINQRNSDITEWRESRMWHFS